MDGQAEIKNWNKSSVAADLGKKTQIFKKNPEKTQIFYYRLANT